MFRFDEGLKVYLHREADRLPTEHQRPGGRWSSRHSGWIRSPQAVYVLRQPAAQPREDSGLGAQRLLAAAQAARGGPVHLARRDGGADADGGATALAARGHRHRASCSSIRIASTSAWPERSTAACNKRCRICPRHAMIRRTPCTSLRTMPAMVQHAYRRRVRSPAAGAGRGHSAQRVVSSANCAWCAPSATCSRSSLNKFKRQLFAAKSEASARDQKDMFFNEAEEPGRAGPAGRRRDASDDKIVRARATSAPSAVASRWIRRCRAKWCVTSCPRTSACARTTAPRCSEIGVETSEQLDIVPQQVRVIRHERVKYACPCCDGGLRLAAKPDAGDPQGAVQRERAGLDRSPRSTSMVCRCIGRPRCWAASAAPTSRATRWPRSVVRVGQAVQPVINLLRDALLDAPLVLRRRDRGAGAEGARAQRPVQELHVGADDRGSRARTARGRRSGCSPTPQSRSTQTAQALYAGMRQGAVLMTDGYEVYDDRGRAHQLVHLGCWAHCRRYFHEALQALPKDKRGPDQLAARFIALIGKLYHVEAQGPRAATGRGRREATRQQDSVPVLDAIEALAAGQRARRAARRACWARRCTTSPSQWPKLKRYVEDGALPHRQQRLRKRRSVRSCVGRRNWLFADTVAGANASANLYSLLQTCQANGIDGYRYLRALLIALPRAKRPTTTRRCCRGLSSWPARREPWPA